MFDEECLRLARSVAESAECYALGRAYTDGGGVEKLLTQDEEPGEDWEQLGASDWLGDVLDIAVTAGLDGEYRSAEVLCAFGGPNITLDTRREVVRCCWGAGVGEWAITSEAAAEIDDVISELWSCR